MAAAIIKPDWVLSYSIIKPKEDLQKMIDNMSEFKAREVFFLENRYQFGYKLKYPPSTTRVTNIQEAISKID